MVKMNKPDENDKPAEGEASQTETTKAEAGEGTPAAETGPAETAGRDLEAALAETKDQLLRTLADMENLRARSAREQEQARKFAIADFARAVLTVADNLHRAVGSAPDPESVADEPTKRLIEGVALTERELAAVLERHHIQKIDPVGEKFSHDLHQAMFEVETAEHPPGTVVEVLQIGYRLHDRLLRPAMVSVAKAGVGGEGGAPPRVDTQA